MSPFYYDKWQTLITTTCDFRHPTSDIRLQTSDFRLQTSDIRHPFQRVF